MIVRGVADMKRAEAGSCVGEMEDVSDKLQSFLANNSQRLTQLLYNRSPLNSYLPNRKPERLPIRPFFRVEVLNFGGVLSVSCKCLRVIRVSQPYILFWSFSGNLLTLGWARHCFGWKAQRFSYMFRCAFCVCIIYDIYTENPNGAPCFDWKWPCLGGLTLKIEVSWVLGMYVCMYVCMYVYLLMVQKSCTSW